MNAHGQMIWCFMGFSAASRWHNDEDYYFLAWSADLYASHFPDVSQAGVKDPDHILRMRELTRRMKKRKAEDSNPNA